MADITRDQFDEDLLVQKKYFQQNKLLLDDEANVIQDIWRYRIGRILSELVESQDVRFGDGFSVVDHGDNNTVTVKAGAIAVLLDDTKSSVRRELIWMDADVNLDSFTTPSGSDRTDYVYLDITEEEVDPSGDPNIINPAYGSETTRDLRLSWSIEISEGSGEGTPPAGHWYRRLAVIQRTNGVAQIQPEDITLSVPDHFAILRQDGSKDLQGDMAVDDDVTIDGVDLSAHREIIYSQTTEAARETGDAEATEYDGSYANCFMAALLSTNPDPQWKVISSHYKHKNINKIYVKYEVQNPYTGATRGRWGLEVNGLLVEETTDSVSSWGTFVTLSVDVSGISDGTHLEIKFGANRHGSDVTIYSRKVEIWASFD